MEQKLLKEMHDSFISETLFFERLDNGLPIYIMPKKGFQQKYAIFTTNYGSLDNKFFVNGTKKLLTVPDGIAHFLEHKMFEDNKVNIFEQFARYGANVNAYTTYTMTSYLFDTIEYFPECLELLLNFVQNLFITEETVQKEKAIIAQEIRMYEDDPDWSTYLNLLQIMFHNHSVKIDIAGTIESIAQVNMELLLKCYNVFYHPGNMVLFIIGDVDPVQVIETVKENQLKKNYSFRAPMKRFFSDEPKQIRASRVENQFSISRPIYHLGFKDQALGEEGDLLHKKDLVMSMLLEILIGKGSELYQKLYESGLIDDSFSVSVTVENDHGMTVLGGHTSDPE
ncbi:MAG: insulinase family protein, partial [Desulfobacterales bacterium]|nr:insulinase family protein [Desulfobacterales bacterium]